jgi:SagB-type dehydrogenase family enzyme
MGTPGGTNRTGRSRLIDRVLLYHEQTKHQTHAYSRSLGRLDWASQPDPFRHYKGAPLVLLSQFAKGPVEALAYDGIFSGDRVALPLDRQTLSCFFFHSLALSAWKQSGQSKWVLRVNPSSGNLHPTEAYVISGPISNLTEKAMIAHYDPYYHGLETRLELSLGEWNQMAGGLPEGSFVVGLTSIHWRESWKYGERAYRYCQHDIGHALACLRTAAMMLGWEVRRLDHFSSTQIETILGVGGQVGHEKEHGACLLAVVPRATLPKDRASVLHCGDGFFHTLAHREWKGEANQLSSIHHDWSIISFVREAIVEGEWTPASFAHQEPGRDSRSLPVSVEAAQSKLATDVIRGRRSAVSMDGETAMSIDDFYRLLWRVHPALNEGFFTGLPFETNVALVLFVHRVEGLVPGLYLFCRGGNQSSELKQALRPGFEWSTPLGCPVELDVVLLKEGDFQDSARTVSCHQSIASDGAFAVAMLANFEGPLSDQGPGLYPRLFWEAGAIGQLMYLEADAAGLSATGIGCYFDDAVHQLLGLEGREWQCLYHFTVGGKQEDERLQSSDAYGHLTPQVVDAGK